MDKKLWITFSLIVVTVVQGQEDDFCLDFRGNQVAVGDRYQPYAGEPCTECICLSDPAFSQASIEFPACVTVQCDQPSCSDFLPVEGECCEYVCPVEEPTIANDTEPLLADFKSSPSLRGRSLPFDDVVEPCCDVGKEWFVNSREQCGPFPTAIKDIAEENQGRCIEFVQLCCIHERQRLECEKGKTHARIERSCEGLHGQQQHDEQKSCCSCCLLGIDASNSGASCDLFSYFFPERCSDTFRECCHEAAAARTQPPVVATPPPSPADGLCGRFPGQLCSDICMDVPGSYRCSCRSGFVLENDGRTCRQETVVNRCWTNNPCDHECVDTGSAINCRCYEGYELQADGRSCEDIDECAEGSFVCRAQQTCVNTDGSYTCVGISGNRRTTTEAPAPQCDRGYVYNPSSGQCEDINECVINRFACAADEECVNTPGGFRCDQPDESLDCGTGFSFNRNTNMCQDINECVIDRFACAAEEECVNTPGSFRCDLLDESLDCGTGFSFNRDTNMCQDINECVIDRFACAADEECVNTPGGFRCDLPDESLDCGTGFSFNRDTNMCQDLDECYEDLHRCQDLDSTCRNTIGSYMCMCHIGYIYNYKLDECEDINECALTTDNCGIGTTCVNAIGSFTCRRTMNCGTGYVLSEETQRCVDIDECDLGTHNCHFSEACRNTPGSFRCVPKTCPPGYRYTEAGGMCEPVVCARGLKPDAIGNCVDINECTERNPCRANQECRNTMGGYQCRSMAQCGAGYRLNEATNTCVDENECLMGTHDCTGPLLGCENRAGSFECTCPEGYQLNNRQCEDTDECTGYYGGTVCGINSQCENTQGSFRCTCNAGFQTNGDYCIDINECERTGMCMHECRNTYGSFVCSCHRGYQLADDMRSCEDIDECAMWEEGGGQLCFGTCRNTQGSYECDCPNGYQMDPSGRACRDINECTIGTADCIGVDDQCINTRGGYKCETVSCPKGFLKNPQSDQRSNAIRCQRQTFVCAQGDEECLYAPLSLSFNFITFPTKIRIPADLFTMRGPQSHHRRLSFDLELISAQDPFTGESRVTRDMFRLDHVSDHEALVRLMEEIQGPQDIELKLNMNIYSREFRVEEEIFFGTAIAVIKIYVTQDLY